MAIDALSTSIPPRHAICLDCRTALLENERCDGGPRHRVVPLATAAGKQKLIDEVWGPANLRRQAKRMVKAGTSGAAGGSLGNCGGADCGGGCGDVGDLGEGFVVILAILAVACVVVVVVWLIFKLVEYLRARADKPKAFGALAHAATIDGIGIFGTVRAPSRCDSPVSAESAVAFALEYRAKSFLGGNVMLRDAATGGFEIDLADGRVASVPAGRIRLGGAHDRVPSSALGLAKAHLASIDPHGGAAGAPATDPFPFDEVYETTVRPGDQIKIYGELVPVAIDAAAGDAELAYRTSASRLAPRGVAAVRVLPRTGGSR